MSDRRQNGISTFVLANAPWVVGIILAGFATYYALKADVAEAGKLAVKNEKAIVDLQTDVTDIKIQQGVMVEKLRREQQLQEQFRAQQSRAIERVLDKLDRSDRN